MGTNQKHTPGPWQIYPAPYPLIETADGIAVAKTDCSLNRVSGKWVEDRETRAANAALISAAPDLLAALEELLADTYLSHPINADRMANARAAILKAKGEA
jgi:hypothetical protein